MEWRRRSRVMTRTASAVRPSHMQEYNSGLAIFEMLRPRDRPYWQSSDPKVPRHRFKCSSELFDLVIGQPPQKLGI